MYDRVPEVNQGMALSSVQESKREQLEREKKHLASRIEDIDKVLAMFDKYPETEELVNLLRRV